MCKCGFQDVRVCLFVFQVCYTEGKYIQVRVHTEVFDPLTRQHKTTNIFHFTFMSDRDVPNIIPKTYGGKRMRSDDMSECLRCVFVSLKHVGGCDLSLLFFLCVLSDRINVVPGWEETLKPDCGTLNATCPLPAKAFTYFIKNAHTLLCFEVQ